MTEPTTTPERKQEGRLTSAELKAAASGKWNLIFEDLSPNLAQALANAPYHVPCPVHGGEDGFRLFSHFIETGRSICNTCGANKNGLETLAFANGWEITRAIAEVAKWLRMEPELIRERKPRYVPSNLPKVDPAEAHRRMSRVWLGSQPIRGTAAELYLLKRGIWRENIPERQLRYHPGLRYIHGKEKKDYGTFPALLASIRNPEGRMISVHRIYITPDGLKAPVPDAKKMMSACGDLSGAAIRLHPAEGEVLGVAEGIETALAAHAVSRMPVWACISATLLEQVQVPANVKRVVIWADKDRPTPRPGTSEMNPPRGAEAAERLARRLESEGKEVEICLPPMDIPEGEKGLDWLDVLNRYGISGFPAHWRRWRPHMTPETMAAIEKMRQQRQAAGQ